MSDRYLDRYRRVVTTSHNLDTETMLPVSRRVTQTKHAVAGESSGNCEAACLASLLGVGIDDLPWPSNREEKSGDFTDYCGRRSSALESLGFQMLFVDIGELYATGTTAEDLHSCGLLIAFVRPESGSSYLHCVIVSQSPGRLNLVHDPAGASRDGEAMVAETLAYLVPLRPWEVLAGHREEGLMRVADAALLLWFVRGREGWEDGPTEDVLWGWLTDCLANIGMDPGLEEGEAIHRSLVSGYEATQGLKRAST